MGHERVGTLPKSKQWRQIVNAVSATHLNPTLVDSVASDTLGLVKGQLATLQADVCIRDAFGFLVSLARAAQSNSVSNLIGKEPSSDPSPLSVAVALRKHLTESSGDPEYKVIAQDAAIDAIGRWHKQERSQSVGSLFEQDGIGDSSWHRLGSGEGFSELSRLFFSSFTERYLTFFLEREVGSALPNLASRDAFQQGLNEHIQDVSKHAFESSKITQSFAAAWFKKNAVGDDPSHQALRGFVNHALGKMRDELNREGSR